MTMPAAPMFPFAITDGHVRLADATAALRGQIVQVLFTAPGERVDRPEFGCGLFDLVFEPNDDLLRAAVEFSVAYGLNRWLGDQIALTGVQVSRDGPTVLVEVGYVRRADLTPDGLRVRFAEGAAWTTG